MFIHRQILQLPWSYKSFNSPKKDKKCEINNWVVWIKAHGFDS